VRSFGAAANGLGTTWKISMVMPPASTSSADTVSFVHGRIEGPEHGGRSDGMGESGAHGIRVERSSRARLHTRAHHRDVRARADQRDFSTGRLGSDSLVYASAAVSKSPHWSINASSSSGLATTCSSSNPLTRTSVTPIRVSGAIFPIRVAIFPIRVAAAMAGTWAVFAKLGATVQWETYRKIPSRPVNGNLTLVVLVGFRSGEATENHFTFASKYQVPSTEY